MLFLKMLIIHKLMKINTKNDYSFFVKIALYSKKIIQFLRPYCIKITNKDLDFF